MTFSARRNYVASLLRGAAKNYPRALSEHWEAIMTCAKQSLLSLSEDEGATKATQMSLILMEELFSAIKGDSKETGASESVAQRRLAGMWANAVEHILPLAFGHSLSVVRRADLVRLEMYNHLSE